MISMIQLNAGNSIILVIFKNFNILIHLLNQHTFLFYSKKVEDFGSIQDELQESTIHASN